MIETALQDRKFAEIVRLEVDSTMTRQHRGMLAAELGIDSRKDVFTVDGIMAKRDLMEIVAIDKPELHFAPHQPLDHYKLSNDFPNIFHLIREEGPFLLQHPYESFSSSVERFLKEASTDPKVLVIKMTLYRTSANSQIIQYLLDAVRNGKQVAVVVELMARFDESANIHWATFLEQAGIHVTYGVVGLKTHSKVIFVVRRDYNGLKRYAHIGTGNYHAGTARAYCDLGLLTCDADIGHDLTEFFNFLTLGYAPARNYKKLLPSPSYSQEDTPGIHQAGNRTAWQGPPGTYPVQEQCPDRYRHHRCPLSGLPGWGQGGPDHPRQLPAAAGYTRIVRQYPGGFRGGPFP
jgi:polyphosphate kinase